MKGLLTTLLIMVFAVGAFAADGPIDKGSMFLGGAAYFQTLGGDYYKDAADNSATVFGIMPEFGYFVSPGIYVGAGVNFASASQGDIKANTFGAGPVIGYYFNMDAARTEIKGSIYPYIKAMMMFESLKTEDGVNPDEKYTVMSFGGAAGINYMFSDAVALDLGIMFLSESHKQKEPTESDNVTGTNIWFGAGFTYFIF